MTYDTIWRIGSNGTSKRRWFVWRHPDTKGQQVLSDNRGNYRRFVSSASAKRAADEANRSGG